MGCRNMLVAFIKSHDDKDCQCEIVKFVDRLWIDKTGTLICVRTLIVYVAPESICLNKIRMITPFRDVIDLDDISYTCWQDNYIFNTKGYSSGGYQIKQCAVDKEYAIINYDNFENVYAYTTNRIKSFETSKSPMCRIISIDFKENPVLPDTYRVIRITFKITSVLDEIFPKVYSLKVDYFNQLLISEHEILDMKTLEIPARKLIDERTKKGGFDVILHLPPDLTARKFNAFTTSVGNEMPDGTLSEKKGEKYFWRGRAIMRASEEYLTSGDAFFTVEGLIGDPFELQEIRGEITQLKKDTGILKILYKRGRQIAILAVILAALSLIFNNYTRIAKFLEASIQVYRGLPSQSQKSN